MNVEEIIRTYISCNGLYYQIEREYGKNFREYMYALYYELRNCSLFESKDRPNMLAIRSRETDRPNCYDFLIYRTDENAKRIEPILIYKNQKQAADQYLKMYQDDNPDVII